MGPSTLTGRPASYGRTWGPRGAAISLGAALVALAVLLGVGCGLVVLGLPAVLVIGGACGIAWLAIARNYPGVALGFWVLLATNTVPFLNVDSFRVPGSFRPEDAILLLLVIAAALAGARGVRPAHLGTWLRGGLALFAAVWLITFLRSWLVAGIPPVPAILFGRDFVFYGVTLVAARYLLSQRQGQVATALATMTGGALVYALAQIAYQVTGLRAGWIVHPHMEAMSASIVRTYQNSTTLVWLLVPITLALGLGMVGRWRGIWLLATVAFVVAALLNQTRASYIGMAVGILVVLILMVRGRWAHTGVRRLYMLLVAMAVAAAVITPLASTALHGAADTVVSRTSSIVAELDRSDQAALATLSYRQSLAHEMLAVLGRDWPIGLGFLHPAVHYVAGLPQGSIRNDDLGLMQVLMTMGALGLSLLLLTVLAPVGTAARWLLGAAGGNGPADPGRMIVSGAVAAVASALAASMTLGTFADGPSAMVAGVIVAVLLVEVARLHPGNNKSGGREARQAEP